MLTMKVMSSQKQSLSLSFKHRQPGSVLVAAIWMLVLFSILSVGLYRIVSSCLNISTRIERRLVGRYLAQAACVLAHLQEENDKTNYDTLYEFTQKQAREIDNLSFEFISEDENAKININASSIDMLSRLPGLSEELANKIAASDLRPYAATEEILDVEGITEEAYKNLESFITVHSDSSVNINTAGKEAFSAIGVEDSLISAIINFREGADGDEGTADDGVFEGVTDIVPKLKTQGISQAQEAELLKFINQNQLRVDSGCRKLKITTAISGKAINRYAVIVDENQIKQWIEL